MTKVSIYEPHTGSTYSADVDESAPLDEVVYAFTNLLRAAGYERGTVQKIMALPHLELEHRAVERRIVERRL
jgi:hypothetical protein